VKVRACLHPAAAEGQGEQRPCPAGVACKRHSRVRALRSRMLCQNRRGWARGTPVTAEAPATAEAPVTAKLPVTASEPPQSRRARLHRQVQRPSSHSMPLHPLRSLKSLRSSSGAAEQPSSKRARLRCGATASEARQAECLHPLRARGTQLLRPPRCTGGSSRGPHSAQKAGTGAPLP